jgi:hypothetical protein
MIPKTWIESPSQSDLLLATAALLGALPAWVLHSAHPFAPSGTVVESGDSSSSFTPFGPLIIVVVGSGSVEISTSTCGCSAALSPRNDSDELV